MTIIGLIIYDEIHGKFLMEFSLNYTNISAFLYCTMLAAIPFGFFQLSQLHIKKISY